MRRDQNSVFLLQKLFFLWENVRANGNSNGVATCENFPLRLCQSRKLFFAIGDGVPNLWFGFQKAFQNFLWEFQTLSLRTFHYCEMFHSSQVEMCPEKSFLSVELQYQVHRVPLFLILSSHLLVTKNNSFWASIIDSECPKVSFKRFHHGVCETIDTFCRIIKNIEKLAILKHVLI